MAQALVNPKLLAWARERASLSIDQIANKLHTKIDKVLAWENGELRPTFKQAQTLSNVFHIPFGYLFLEQPPIEKPPIPDLRTVGSTPLHDYSLELRDVINDMLLKQDWYVEYARNFASDPLPFIGRNSVNDNHLRVAQDIKRALQVDEFSLKTVGGNDKYIDYLVEKVESIGILVFRKGYVGTNTHRAFNVGEFRGFTLLDDEGYAPLIFINSKDSRAAQIFTLIHEIAHIWIGASGVSNAYIDHRMDDKDTEYFCNLVAAEFLLPEILFGKYWSDDKSLYSNAIDMKKVFKVSAIVIARRAYDLKYIDWDTYYEFYLSEKENWRKFSNDGGQFYNTAIFANSKLFSKAVLAQAYSGNLQFAEAANLLNLSVKTLDEFAKKSGFV